MKIALISPKGPLYRRSGIFRKSLRYMPLTLPTLAALVPAELDADVVCVDEGIEEVDLDIDADLIGMTVITGTAPRAYDLARHFRAAGKTVVLGGPHVTLVPDDAQPHADSIVVGYAEQEWPRLLRDYHAGTLKSRYTQRADLDLSGMPSVDRSVLPEKSYLTAEVFEATRACVHNCSFCVVPSAWGRKPLTKPIDELIDEIRSRKARRAIFVDLNLIANRDYALELFEALIPLRIQWFGLATTLLCEDTPLLDLAAESGCRGLLMGLESIRPANLAASRKRFNHPENYERLVQMLHERNISLQGCFVFGMDHDTPDVFQETSELAVDIGIDLPRFAILTPFPGTALYESLDSESRILSRNWELYDGQHVVFQPAQMSPIDLARGNEAAWRYAYGWRNIARRLKHTAAPFWIAATTNLGYRYYARRLDRFYNCDWMIPQAKFDRNKDPIEPTTPELVSIGGRDE